MNKKIFIIPAVILVTSIFIIVSILVYLTKAKKPNLINSKLKIGALLLTLTGALNNTTPVYSTDIMCYFVMPPVQIDMQEPSEKFENGIFILGLSQTNVIVFLARGYGLTNQSTFVVVPENDDIITSAVCTGVIKPKDGSFDNNFETFSVLIENPIPAGRYFIKIFKDEQGSIRFNNPDAVFRIIVK